MNLPKLVIFDMDGLIFDTERLFMQEKNKILIEYGYPAREEDYIQTIGLAGETLAAKLAELYGADYPADEISAKTRENVNASIKVHGPEIKPGIRRLLDWLKTKNIPCCVASSTLREHVEHYLSLAGLSSYFSFIIGGAEAKRSKPAPDIFLTCCTHYGTQPQQALVLEDSENGVLAAAAAGIPVLCIPDLKEPAPGIAQKAAAVLESAEDVIAFLES